jgi:hypothetical protein
MVHHSTGFDFEIVPNGAHHLVIADPRVAIEVHSPANILISASGSCDEGEKIQNGEHLSRKGGCAVCVELTQVVYQILSLISALHTVRNQEFCI